MKCKKCGTDCTGNFCQKCGSKVEATTQTTTSMKSTPKKPATINTKKRAPLSGIILLLLATIIVIGTIVIIFGPSENNSNSQDFLDNSSTESNFEATENNATDAEWDDFYLGDVLPTPSLTIEEVTQDTLTRLVVNFNNVSSAKFNSYVKECKNWGFTVDADLASSSYEAYNAEGYKLRLHYYKSSSLMKISLEKLKEHEMIPLIWPNTPVAQQLPKPKSEIGEFSTNRETRLEVYIGNTSKTQYAEYVSQCYEKGFTIDGYKYDDTFVAYNSSGWRVSVDYEGNNVMRIYSYQAETKISDTTTSSENTITDTKTENTNQTGLRAEFKTAMDSYETFMDGYVSFMKKYKATPSDISLLSDYADYMKKYTEFASDFEKWDEKNLNTEETNYYIEVQTRVSKKLLELAQ